MRLFAARLTTCLILTLSILSPAAALAQGFSALARVLPEQSSLVDKGSDVELQLGLSQGVPYRILRCATLSAGIGLSGSGLDRAAARGI